MRTNWILLAALLLVPSPAAAQLGFLAGVGLSSPMGDFSDTAGSGYHVGAGVQVGIPTLPVALRLHGDYHRLSEADAAFEAPRILAGALNVVFTPPAVGLSPYFLSGIGRYRLEAGAAGAPTTSYTNGFQLGFGIELDAGGLGGFAELRWVRLSGEADHPQYVPFTVGIRL